MNPTAPSPASRQAPTYQLEPIPAFADNYLWLLHDGREALVVDPGDAAPVTAALTSRGLSLQSILITHHHADHIGGVMALRRTWPRLQVWGPLRERIEGIDTRVDSASRVNTLGLSFAVLDTPGHTAGHVSYFCDSVAFADPAPVLFCGDTLFSAGCGRVFEGDPAQMHGSLMQLAKLPGDSLVCCAHEYTLSNLRFALAADPESAALQAYAERCRGLRAQQRPTLPSTIRTERAINPFLRCDSATLQRSARASPGFSELADQWHSHGPEIITFAALRHWKNVF